jgi:hypothetical protein
MKFIYGSRFDVLKNDIENIPYISESILFKIIGKASIEMSYWYLFIG